MHQQKNWRKKIYFELFNIKINMDKSDYKGAKLLSVILEMK